MRSQRKLDPGRPLSSEEAIELALYLKADCEPVKDSASYPDSTAADHGGRGNTLGLEYPKYVDQFVKVLNKRSVYYRRPRITVRNLWKSKALPKCQVIAMCNYVVLCASTEDEEKKAKSFIERRFTAAENVKSTIAQLIKLRKSTEDEECSASHQFGFSELNMELRSILNLMSACIEAVQEIRAIRKPSFSLARVLGSHALLKRQYRDQFLNPPHPRGRRANAAGAECMLPVLHEAITGKLPNDEVETNYIAVNMERDARRLADEPTIARLGALIDKFDEIIPGFMERINFENLESMPKMPLLAPVSPDASETLWLGDLHSAYTNCNNQSAFLNFLRDLVEELYSKTRQKH